MPLKNELRKSLKKLRKSISNKNEADNMISKRLLELPEYKNAGLVLFYAALDDEVNLDYCIETALANGKKVALPVCTDKDGNMKYYYINSFNDMVSGSFGIREPDTEKCVEVKDFSASLCVVPAIAFDKRKYRLGYGKGYYDRFLKNYAYKSVGVCYNNLVVDELPADEYDIPVDIIITQDSVL